MDHDAEMGSVSGSSSSNAEVEFSDVELGLSRAGQGVAQKASSAEFVAMRRWQRFCVDMAVQVRVTTQGPTKVVTWEGQGTDISAGGLAIAVDSNLPIGSQVGVEFTLPNSDLPMTFRCFVRNRDGNRYGIEFITENDEDYRKTGELQATLAAMNPEPTG
jgi:c-di-GMP-binding flagellar brake protein YcgR